MLKSIIIMGFTCEVLNDLLTYLLSFEKSKLISCLLKLVTVGKYSKCSGQLVNQTSLTIINKTQTIKDKLSDNAKGKNGRQARHLNLGPTKQSTDYAP